MFTYRRASINDIRPITELALLLYADDNTLEGLYGEYKESLQSDRLAVFLAMDSCWISPLLLLRRNISVPSRSSRTTIHD